jgi:hypothetical protein
LAGKRPTHENETRILRAGPNGSTLTAKGAAIWDHPAHLSKGSSFIRGDAQRIGETKP